MEDRATSGNKIENGALRWSTGKTEVQRVPPSLIKAVARVLQKSSVKYPDSDDGTANWMRGMDYQGLIGNMMRHLLAFQEGEDLDKETGEHHLAHMVCNAAFILEFDVKGLGNKLDNRMFREIKNG